MLLQLLSYLALVVFVAGILTKVVKYLRMPIHLRWELYPIPHEKGREYGGSYFEELNWWEKPKEKKSLIGQMKFIVPEILFVKGLYHDNRKLWWASFPFHFGMYLIIGWLALLLIGALLSIAGLSPGSSLAVLFQSLAIILGAVGFIVGTLGCIGLLFLRVFDSDLRSFAAPKDYFNLLFILSIFLTGLLAWSYSDPSFVIFRDYLKGLITFKPATVESSLVLANIILLSLFCMYIPFTHMTHFFAKYFMWDKVRWDDERNLPGSAIEAKVNEVLNYRQNWSAPHIKSGKTWAETATEEVE
ncbi:MAG: respiratory nitrate reductase subunit gamma [Syntrophales bacterium]